MSTLIASRRLCLRRRTRYCSQHSYVDTCAVLSNHRKWFSSYAPVPTFQKHISSTALQTVHRVSPVDDGLDTKLFSETDGGKLSGLLAESSISKVPQLTSDEWPDVMRTDGPVLVTRFPNLSFEYPAGSHPAEIMDLCREKARVAMFAPVARTLEGLLPVDIIFQFLIFWQSQLGFSCAKSIIATALLFRTLLLPLVFAVERARRKTSLHEPTLREFRERLTNSNSKATTSPSEIQELATNYRKQHNISVIPKATVLQQVIQLPILITFWNCIHIIGCNPETYRQFTMEAPLWLTSLCLPDPLYILPVIFSALLVLQLELTSATDRNIQSRAYIHRKHTMLMKQAAYLKRSYFISRMGRLSGIFSVFMTARLASGLLLYMTVNLAFQVITTALCRLPVVEKALGLPPAQLGVKDDLNRLLNTFMAKSKEVLSPLFPFGTLPVKTNSHLRLYYPNVSAPFLKKSAALYQTIVLRVMTVLRPNRFKLPTTAHATYRASNHGYPRSAQKGQQHYTRPRQRGV